MDVFIAIVAGLAFRLVLNNLHGPIAPLSPALLGLCEGALVHYLPNRTSNSFLDHYLAYGLRIVVDLFFTENVSRMFLVLLWTALSIVASDALKPVSHHERKRSRRYTARNVAPTVTPRPQQLSTPLPLKSPSTHSPLQYSPYDLYPTLSIPLHFNPDRPPSPPSFFLEEKSETNNVFPTSEQQLEYGPERSSPSNSSSPKITLLPIAPTAAALVTEVQQSDTLSNHRLSTIQELSADDSRNVDKTDIWTKAGHAHHPGTHFGVDKADTSYAPSVGTSAPLPVPNATYIRANWTLKGALVGDGSDPLYSPPVSTSAPLPVPSAAILSQHSEWKTDSASEPDGLGTPGAHKWELTDQDELRTPPAPQTELSPFFSSQQLPAGFSVTGEIQSDIAPPPVDPGVSNVSSSEIPAMSTIPKSSVECSPKVVSDQNPDLDKLSEAEAIQSETDSTSVMSPGNSKQLFSRGEYYREEARKQEKQRLALDNQLKAAFKEARIRDTLFLREDINVSEERAKKLHEKAARRFFKGKYIPISFVKESFDQFL